MVGHLNAEYREATVEWLTSEILRLHSRTLDVFNSVQYRSVKREMVSFHLLARLVMRLREGNFLLMSTSDHADIAAPSAHLRGTQGANREQLNLLMTCW